MTCLSEFSIDDLVIHGSGAPSRSSAHVAECARCQARIGARRREADLFAAAAPAIWHGIQQRRRPATAERWRRFLRLVSFAAVPAAVAVAIGLAGGGRPPSIRKTGSNAAYVGAKGSPHLQVVVRRDGALFAAETGATPVRAGDELRFVPAPAGASRYIAVLGIDGNGTTSFFFPPSAGESSIALPPPGEALPGSIVLDDAPGPERLFIVFSDGPIPARLIEAAALADLRGSKEPALSHRTVQSFWVTLEKDRATSRSQNK